MTPTHTLALVGLGKMGANMARRLVRAGLTVHGFDTNREAARQLAAEHERLTTHDSLQDLVDALPSPRVVWLMLPHGEITDSTLSRLTDMLAPGDLIVDGANGFYKDAVAREQTLKAHDLLFADVGVSGGGWGLENGYTLMVGAQAPALTRLRPVIEALAPAPDRGWLHCGPVGSGHYVKMVHNGIEYGMMQAFAEGFALMEAKREFDLDLSGIAEVWRHGSVIRSWLLDLTAASLSRDSQMVDIAPVVADSGEGRWTVQEAIELGVPAPVIGGALFARFSSQGKADFGSKLLAMMRRAFGGHAVRNQTTVHKAEAGA